MSPLPVNLLEQRRLQLQPVSSPEQTSPCAPPPPVCPSPLSTTATAAAFCSRPVKKPFSLPGGGRRFKFTANKRSAVFDSRPQHGSFPRTYDATRSPPCKTPTSAVVAARGGAGHGGGTGGGLSERRCNLAVCEEAGQNSLYHLIDAALKAKRFSIF